MTLARAVGQRRGDDLQIPGAVLGLADREKAPRLGCRLVGKYLALGPDQTRHRKTICPQIGADIDGRHPRSQPAGDERRFLLEPFFLFENDVSGDRVERGGDDDERSIGHTQGHFIHRVVSNVLGS
jgi:hypothetical protein